GQLLAVRQPDRRGTPRDTEEFAAVADYLTLAREIEARRPVEVREAWQASALAPGAGLAGSSVLLDVADAEAGHVLAGGRLDALQSRRGIDLHYHRTVVGAQDIHPCHVQPHHLGRAYGGHALLGGDLDQAGAAAAVQIGAELPRPRLAFHG